MAAMHDATSTAPGTSATSAALYDLLADALPKDTTFTFYHYSTPPTKSSAIFSAPPNAKSERTYCESHFLAATIDAKGTTEETTSDELLVLAIEVLVYSTKHLTTLFVSKADSTGYLSLQHNRKQGESPLKVICGTFVSWLAKQRQREGKKTVVSLFARAQDQYLFPASIDNKGKHLLDDKQLVRWWCKVLDPLIHEYKVEEIAKPFTERLAAVDSSLKSTPSSSESTAKGFLIIPGFEPYDTLRFYTPPLPSPTAPRRWAATHPLLQIAPHPSAPPRCLIPHFPDDPKARFLDELDGELPDRGSEAMTKEGGTPSRSNGQWKSVKTLDQFWEFMAFRQECSSGRIVGFIWVVITPPKPTIPEEDESEPSQFSISSQGESQAPATSSQPCLKDKTPKKTRRRRANTTYGPIPLILPRIKSSSSTLSTMSTGSGVTMIAHIPHKSPHYSWPPDSRGTVVFSSKDYDRAHQVLLQQNFSTRAAAARSTQRWKEEIAVLGSVNDWSRTVKGKKESINADDVSTKGDAPATNLIGVRKKRKPTEAESSNLSSTEPAMLGEGLVRKKAKVEPTAADDGIRTLGVRRKPKQTS